MTLTRRFSAKKTAKRRRSVPHALSSAAALARLEHRSELQATSRMFKSFGMAGYESDETTTAVTEYLLKTNRFVGHWKHGSKRPPAEFSDVTATYVALRALGSYGTAQQQERIDDHTKSAGEWLMDCRTKDTEDRVFQLCALAYLGKSEARQRELADELIAQQREDGGWAQMVDMTSDAYASGTTLTCLARTGHLQPTDQAYKRGLEYLLKTRMEDGSWHVVSRSDPLQEYFESGFPHQDDQYISTTATAWAVMAMLLSLNEPT